MDNIISKYPFTSCIIFSVVYIVLFNLIIKIVKVTNEKFSNEVPTVAFPFKNLFDETGKKLNIILLSAPFRGADHDKLYDEYKAKGLDFCGISSYREFPQKIVNVYEDRYHESKKHNYLKMATAWLHCFRNPDAYIQSPTYLENEEKVYLPNILMTESDLKEPDHYKYNPDIKKEYDFMYVCLKDNNECTDGWQSTARNWELAKKCLIVMCRDFKLKGILVGRENCKITEFCSGMLKIVDLLPYHEFQAEMQKAKFLFVPNIEDAAPRVITEAMLYNIPVLVNENIVGGFHNIISGVTGEFFTDENNVVPALKKIVETPTIYKPREWYLKNRGRKNSGKILAKFLIENYPNINNKNMEYAYIS